MLISVHVVLTVHAGRGAQGASRPVCDCGIVHQLGVHGQRLHQPSRSQLAY